MRSAQVRSARWGLVAIVLMATLAACSSGEDAQGQSATQTSSSEPQTIQVRVTGNQVQTAEQRVKVKLGTEVRLEVTADRADEVHLHSYDRKVDLQPGKPAVLELQVS